MNGSDRISVIEPTTTSERCADGPTIAPSRIWERSIDASRCTSMSSSRFESWIRTPGWISQKRPIRTAGPISTRPSAIFSASVEPLVESRIASDSGAIQTLRSGSNGGPSSRSTDSNLPWSTSTIVSR